MAMQTITGQEIGSAFINKLNANFDEVQSSAPVADGNVAVIIPLQGGELKSATGYADGRWCEPVTLTLGQNQPSSLTYTDDNFNKYLHTPCYLSLEGNAVKAVTVPTGSTLTIFCYDSTFTLLSGGVVNDVANIPASAAYVKMQIYNASGYAQVLSLAMTLAAEPKWVKNTFTPLTYQFHNYECHPPLLWDDMPTCSIPHEMPTDASADTDNTRYHDNCFVMLPPNYDPQGEPCKFIIWFQGDGSRAFMWHNPFLGTSGGKVAQSIYEQNYKYLNNMGYAVVSLGGYTSMWKNEVGAASQPGWWQPRISPAYIASVRGLYEFLMRNYNFDPRCYITAKSAGGSMLLHTAASLPFPVRAAAGLSIGISTTDGMTQNALVSQKSFQKRQGVANWNSFVLNNRDYSIVSDGDRASKKSGATANQIADADRLIANKETYLQIDQFTLMSDMDYSDYLNAILLYDPFNDAEPPQALTNLINNSHKNMRVPVKLWCATKDPSVPYSWHKLYADWVSRCNGICELRSYTGDDGSHSTFCGGTSGGGKVANNLPTPYGGTMSGVNIGVVEAVEWFKRW